MTGLRSLLGFDLPPLEAGTPGDPGLFGPGSSPWRIGRERVLLLGGAAALLLQIAHPLVAEAVEQHSAFRTDSVGRLRATLDATLRITFGDTAQAEAAAARVRSVHAGVRGALGARVGPFGAGTPFDAADPGLATWVHTTVIWTSLETYSRFVRPLDPEERATHWREAEPFGRLFGAAEPEDGYEAHFARMVGGPDLAIGPTAQGLARDILAPPVPAGARPVLPLLRIVTAGILPGTVREAFGLAWGRTDRSVFSIFSGLVRSTLSLMGPDLRFWPHARVAGHRVSMREHSRDRDRSG